MEKIVILGAGLTGLSAAYHLEQAGMTDYLLVEKEAEVGGLCRSVVQDGFTFDYTGHLLHLNDAYCTELVAKLIGLDQFVPVARRSYVYSHDRYTDYPYQMNLRGLPPEVIADCVQGFVQRRQTRKKPRSFVDWVLTQFGSGFGRHFFFPYQKKIFAYPLKHITASWTGRFVPSTSLSAILGGIGEQHNAAPKQSVGYNAHFLYPHKNGIATLVNGIARHLRKPVQLETAVTAVCLRSKTVTLSDGTQHAFAHLISTLPLPRLLRLVRNGSDAIHLSRAIPLLRCNSVINFNLGIQRPDVSDKHWIYYPEPQYPFYRLGFPHNFAPSMAPAGCSSLYGEFAYVKKSKQWIAHTLEHALAQTKKVLSIADKDIMCQKVIPIDYAYVIYDWWRERNVPKIHARLEQHHIYSVGRYGAWKYSSMQEAILDGKAIADLVCKQQHAQEATYNHAPKDALPKGLRL